MTLEIREKETVLAGVTRVIDEQLGESITLLTDGTGIHDAVHGVRRRLKITRAALRIVRDHIGQKAYRRYNIACRDLGRAFHAFRDAQSLVETVDTFDKRFSSVVQPQLISGLQADFANTRDILSDQSLSDTVAHVHDGLAELKATIDLTRRGHEMAVQDLASGLSRVYRRGYRRYRQTNSKADDFILHDWRKRAKYLRYQMDMLQNQWPEYFLAMEKELHALTDILGDHHNLEMLRHRMIDTAGNGGNPVVHPGGNGSGAIAALAQEQQRHLWQKAMTVGLRLYTEKPGAFTRRITGILLARQMQD